MFLIGVEGNFYVWIMHGSMLFAWCCGVLDRSLSMELRSLVHLSHCA